VIFSGKCSIRNYYVTCISTVVYNLTLHSILDTSDQRRKLNIGELT